MFSFGEAATVPLPDIKRFGRLGHDRLRGVRWAQTMHWLGAAAVVADGVGIENDSRRVSCRLVDQAIGLLFC